MTMDGVVPSKFVEVLSRALHSMCTDEQIAFTSSVRFTGNLFMTIDQGSTIDFLVNEYILRTETNNIIFQSNSCQGYVYQEKPPHIQQDENNVTRIEEGEIYNSNADDASTSSKYFHENYSHNTDSAGVPDEALPNEKQEISSSDTEVKHELWEQSIDLNQIYAESIASAIKMSEREDLAENSSHDEGESYKDCFLCHSVILIH